MDSEDKENIGRFCGSVPPPPIVISKKYRSVVLYFQSDSAMYGRGFNVTYFYSNACKYVSVITHDLVSYTV